MNCYHRWTWVHDFKGIDSKWWFRAHCRDCNKNQDFPYPNSEEVEE